MDTISISDMKVRAVIGTLPGERMQKQTLLLNVDLYGDFRMAGERDDFSMTFDYSKIEREIHDYVSGSSFHLLEALAEHLAAKCLAENPLLNGIRLRIAKPNAACFSREIGIEIRRFASGGASPGSEEPGASE